MHLLVELVAKKEHLSLIDRTGVIHAGRDDLNIYKREFALDTPHRTMADDIHDADAFIGLSGPNLETVDMLAAIAPKPVIFALSNPDPEFCPELARTVRI